MRTAYGAESQSELVFRVDDDDQDTRNFLANHVHCTVLVGPRMLGYKSMPAFFNELAVAATGDVLMCGNDDMVFQTLNWAPLILAKANEFPDGLFNIGVSVYNEDHYPFSVISRRAAEYLGFIWDPRIFWGDIYLRDVMGTLGRLARLPDVVIDHDWIGHAPDKTFLESDRDLHNPQYWPVTHAQCVTDAVQKLRELL